MFTIKAYRGQNVRIFEADSLTILREESVAEITMHRHVGEDNRIDVGPDRPRDVIMPPLFDYAVVENAAGKTSEIIRPAFPPST